METLLYTLFILFSFFFFFHLFHFSDTKSGAQITTKAVACDFIVTALSQQAVKGKR